MEQFESTGCINCHSGPMFSDFTPHVLGVPDNPKLPESDAGVNKTYAFRTPSLRNLSATAPYMHNGTSRPFQTSSVSTGGSAAVEDEAAVADADADVTVQVSRDQIDPLARRLNMRGGGQRDLIAFLRALDDPNFDRTVPERVPSGLPVGGKLQP